MAESDDARSRRRPQARLLRRRRPQPPLPAVTASHGEPHIFPSAPSISAPEIAMCVPDRVLGFFFWSQHPFLNFILYARIVMPYGLKLLVVVFWPSKF